VVDSTSKPKKKREEEKDGNYYDLGGGRIEVCGVTKDESY